MVNVAKLVSAIGALAWRAGCKRGDEVTHRVEPDGSHVIAIKVPAYLVDLVSQPPKTEAKPFSWGLTTPEIKR